MPTNHDGDRSFPPPAPRRSGRTSQPIRYEGQRTTAGNNNVDNVLSHTFLLWVLRQWWLIVIPVGLVLASIAGVLVIYFYVPKYESAALLTIESTQPALIFPSNNGGQSERYIQTQLELLRSGVVLEPVLARPEIAGLNELVGKQDRVKHLRNGLGIRQRGQSDLYDITFASVFAKDAATIVNAVIAVFMEIHDREEFHRSQRVIDILEEERRRRGLEVERLRKNLVDLAKEVTGTDPFAGNQVTDFNRALSPATALFQSLTEVEVNQEVQRAELKSLQAAPALDQMNADASGLIDLIVDDQADIRAREQAIKEIESLLEKIKISATRLQRDPQLEKDANYVGLRGDLEQQRKDLAEARVKARKIIVEQRRVKREEDQKQQVAEIERELGSLESRRKLLGKRLQEQIAELKTGGGKSVELQFAKAELEREEKVFEMIADRKLALQTELRAPARVQVRQKAEASSIPLQPIPYKLLFLACSAAFAAPLGLAVVREITVRRISDSEQLSQESGLRVLGEVAALPVRYVAVSPNQLSGRLRRDTYIFAESINSLRTNIDLANGHDRHVYAVTSAAPSEGKTSVAVSLAMSIANSCDEPILIIDGDMRSPFVANMLKAKNQPGLFELLSQKVKLEDTIQSTGQNQLYVIPAGRATRSTHSVVDIAELKRLIDQLRTRFKTIIIDTPPILGASESLILAKAADSVLFCSLANVSKARQVRLAIDRLEHSQVNLEGAVLSGMPAKQYEHVYGYYANRIDAQQ